MLYSKISITMKLYLAIATIYSLFGHVYKIITRSILKKDERLFVIGTSHLLIGGGRLFFLRKERY